MKKLEKLLCGLTIQKSIGEIDLNIKGIEIDSRKVEPGFIFFAISGTHNDGHDYIEKAIGNGAVVIICEKLPSEINNDITYLKVKNSSASLGIIASNFYDNPSQKLKLYGVTGTNGKTTTATLLYRMASSLGFKSGLISTIVYLISDKEYQSSHTTPDQLQLNKLLFEMVNEGCEYCFMEVSSHAIDQNRIFGLDFDGAIFSNITHDHLDYHKTFDEYLRVKKQFFDFLKPEAFALTNIDDKNGNIIVQNTKAKKYTYSLRTLADYKCKILESHFDGMLLNLDSNEVWTHFVGKFNAYNLLAVYSASLLIGFEKQNVLVELSKMIPVNGRFEVIKSPEGKFAIVDYAHTPDALENVLSTINEIRSKNEAIICVAGAGGDRDKTKRPKMASIACKYSDKVILTSDNPRTEDPKEILRDMESGVDINNSKKVLTIQDRYEAIKTAVMLAIPGDIILIAGKGHENYQEINGVKYHFDDKEVIKKVFEIE
ncbi:MAG: UDP-N-acetylmuramoyl-L-alanyl-D-glutamate--2,6-diaminopimelate ligase [Prolixibacteraceae bacterium]|nr:UDP-N-acetylmuramoyl-L-alanyl-D-glutamate--2,6-diaminopimelate ligase [Prolixibacteraceae bacterium]